MSIFNLLQSRTAKIAGKIVLACGLFKPVIEIIRLVLDMIGEGQTFTGLWSSIWPDVKSLVLLTYNALPIWLNVLLVVAGGWLLFVNRSGKPAPPPQPAPPGGTVFTPIVTLGSPPQIFVAGISAVFGAHSRDGFIRFKIVVVACSPLTLSRFLAGRISCRLDASGKTRTVLTSQITATTALLLAEPSIESANLVGHLTVAKSDATNFAINRGVSTIVLKQYVSPAESANMTVALTPNRGLEFDFTDLRLSIASPQSGTEERLALWDGIACAVGDVSSYRIRVNKTGPGLSEMMEDILSK